MKAIAAVDIMDGKVVRLLRGNPKESKYLMILDLLQNRNCLFFWQDPAPLCWQDAKVRTLSVSASCTITGTMPPLFAKSISPISFSMHKADSCTL